MQAPDIHPKLSALPHRSVQLPGLDCALLVPRHIVRIDIEKPSRSGTHGWQVRGPKPWVLFSDARHGGATQALAAAVTTLAAGWQGNTPRKVTRERPSKQLPVGMPGVRVIWRRRKGATFRQCYVRVDRLDGSQLVSLYVGTDRTTTDERLQTKLAEAVGIRKLYLAKQGRHPLKTDG